MNIYLKTVENGEIVLRGIHIPLEVDWFRSLAIGKRLMAKGGVVLGKVETSEDLRTQPIGFNIDNQDDWLAVCRRMMPEMAECWEEIASERDKQREHSLIGVVREVRARVGDNNVLFQLEMARRGHKLNEVGAHGSGYLGDQKTGMMQFKIEFRNGQYYTEPMVDTQGRLVCPVCGEVVSSDELSCHRCGVKLAKS